VLRFSLSPSHSNGSSGLGDVCEAQRLTFLDVPPCFSRSPPSPSPVPPSPSPSPSPSLSPFLSLSLARRPPRSLPSSRRRRYLYPGDFYRNGVPASIGATTIVITIGYAIMRLLGL